MPATPVHVQVLIPNTLLSLFQVYARFQNNARALVYAQEIEAAILYARGLYTGFYSSARRCVTEALRTLCSALGHGSISVLFGTDIPVPVGATAVLRSAVISYLLAG